MPSNTIDIDTYTFKETDSLLFDANIWIYLYGPQVKNDQRTKAYSNALKKILLARSHTLVNVLILSEFANRFARMEYEMWTGRKCSRKFKDFRQHPDYEPIAQAISASIRKIMHTSGKISTGFDSVDIEGLLESFDSQKLDFNDIILANLCKAKGLMLVTHDGDFADSGITVLTANRTLLAKTIVEEAAESNDLGVEKPD